MTSVLRLISLVICTGAIIAAACLFHFYNYVFTDGMGQVWAVLLLAASIFTALWDTAYLATISARASIPHAVTITFDLLSWLLSISMTSTAAASTLWDEANQSCRTGDQCGDWRKVTAATISACVLNLILVYVRRPKNKQDSEKTDSDATYRIIHFALFIMAIKAIQRDKKAAAIGVPLADVVA